jgi:hypothetical protein
MPGPAGTRLQMVSTTSRGGEGICAYYLKEDCRQCMSGHVPGEVPTGAPQQRRELRNAS